MLYVHHSLQPSHKWTVNGYAKQLFHKVYDGTETIRNKNAMEYYNVLDLEKDDLILIECKLTRYRTKEADNKTWLQRTQMELLAISLLHKRVERAGTTEHEDRDVGDLCI